METKKERNALRNLTCKDPKGTFSLKKIAHHSMKTMTMKKKPMREYCLWPSIINPSIINKRYKTTKRMDHRRIL